MSKSSESSEKSSKSLKGNFLKSFSSVSFWTLCSRIAGFLRESILAGILGASAVTDMLFLAIKIPALFRRVFAEGALGNSFVPIFSKLYLGRDDHSVNAHSQSELDPGLYFAKRVLVSIAFVVLTMTILFEIFADQICSLLFAGLSEEKLDMFIPLVRISFPFLFLIFLASFYGSMLNSVQKFSAYAISPMIGNFYITACLLIMWFFDVISAKGIIASYTTSGLVQFLVVFFVACRMRIFLGKGVLKEFVNIPSEIFQKIIKSRSLSTQGIDNDSSMRMFFKKFLSAAFSSSIAQLDIFIGIYLASFLGVGGISYLNYADRIVQLPLSIIGISTTTVLLSLLSKRIAINDVDGVKKMQNSAFEFTMIVAVFFAFHIFFFADTIINLIYGWGKFTADNVKSTAAALKGYAIGIPFFILFKIFNTFCFVRSDMDTPLKINTALVFINIGFSIIGFKFYEFIGIAYATSMSSIVAFFIFIIMIGKKGYFKIDLLFCMRLLFLIGVLGLLVSFLSDMVINKYCLSALSAGLFVFIAILTRLISKNKIKSLVE